MPCAHEVSNPVLAILVIYMAPITVVPEKCHILKVFVLTPPAPGAWGSAECMPDGRGEM